MKLGTNRRLQLLLIWLVVIPPTTIYLVLHHWPTHLNGIYFGMIILFSCLSALVPVKLNGNPGYLVLWITVPAFLLYGLIIEIIAMQVVVLTVLLVNRKQNFNVSKFLMSSLVLFLISFISAAAFDLAGGEIGMMNFWPLLFFVIIYQLTQRVSYVGIFAIYRKIKHPNQNDFAKQILLETLITLLLLPFTLTLYYLVQFIGIGAFFLLGIPLLFLIILLRRYNHNEKINAALERVSQIGQSLSYNTNEVEVIDEFVESVSELFDADFTYLYDYHDAWLEPLRIYEDDTFKEVITTQLIVKDGITKILLKDKKALIYDERADWVRLSEGYNHPEMQSMFAIPILRDQEVTGVLVVASKRKNEFKEYQLQIAEILCSYFTVSIVRARNIAETIQQSERCGLTSLYNYNYLEERLQFEYNRFQQNNINKLTVVLLDIDYFKKVNDTYGHESGNEVLVELARILEKYTPQNGIAGRYGGEEFIYILPNMSKEEGVQFGEMLRREIEAHKFKINPDLGQIKKTIDIAITLSIGVSSIPEDTEELQSLVRNADRALYLGAKRAGRNRVASYVK